MTETPITPEDPEIPDDAPPGREDPDPEIHDQPLGVPADADPDTAPAPGLPQKEPPAAS